jgi:hypothetical protein
MAVWCSMWVPGRKLSSRIHREHVSSNPIPIWKCFESFSAKSSITGNNQQLNDKEANSVKAEEKLRSLEEVKEKRKAVDALCCWILQSTN